jgi:hypothetical protein
MSTQNAILRNFNISGEIDEHPVIINLSLPPTIFFILENTIGSKTKEEADPELSKELSFEFTHLSMNQYPQPLAPFNLACMV